MNKLSEVISNAKKIFETDEGDGLDIKEAEKSISAYLSKIIDVNVHCKLRSISNKEYELTTDVTFKPKMFKSCRISTNGWIKKAPSGDYYVPLVYKFERSNGSSAIEPIDSIVINSDGKIIK